MRLSSFSFRLLLILIAPLLACGCRAESVGTTEPRATKTINDTSPSIAEPVSIEAVPERAAPDVKAIVNAYNFRQVGSPGWRRVVLDLRHETEVTKSFTVVNLWNSGESDVRTLFYLEEPPGLSGTSYLLIEGNGLNQQQEMKVHLFLPAGERRVLEIMPSNFAEGLLGSDFTYTDLRMRLPLNGYEYRLAGQATLLGEPSWAIEARPITPATRQTVAWSKAHFYLAKRFSFMLGADYFGEAHNGTDAPPIVKRLRVESFKQMDEMWTATSMVMFGSNKDSSRITLKDARFNLKKFDPGILTPAELPSMDAHVNGLDKD
jgi:hypothetical protein